MYRSSVAIEEKEKLIKEIGEKYKGLNFEAQSIHIFNNDGDPQDWYELKEIPFNTSCHFETKARNLAR
ncbi:hypothetical protein HY439_00895 [Candidatus Microgenomates bacterium]|nr:hypothetical protein [Candidatus Microgenomates bacterium]